MQPPPRPVYVGHTCCVTCAKVVIIIWCICKIIYGMTMCVIQAGNANRMPANSTVTVSSGISVKSVFIVQSIHGFFVFAYGFVGIVGTCCENLCMLNTYAIFTLINLVVSLILGILALVADSSPEMVGFAVGQFLDAIGCCFLMWCVCAVIKSIKACRTYGLKR